MGAMFEGTPQRGVPAAWCAKVKDGAGLLERVRRLVDASIVQR